MKGKDEEREVKEGKGEEDKGKGIEYGYMYGKKKKIL